MVRRIVKRNKVGMTGGNEVGVLGDLYILNCGEPRCYHDGSLSQMGWPLIQNYDFFLAISQHFQFFQVFFRLTTIF